jgi:hypothetical protein
MAGKQETSQASVIEARLSSKQRFWLKHLQACEAGGETLKVYAKRKGLSVHGLYGARRRMRLAGIAPARASSEKRPSFAKVVVHEAPVEAGRCRVRLPNGAVMEWDVPLTAQSFELLFQTVARLS